MCKRLKSAINARAENARREHRKAAGESRPLFKAKEQKVRKQNKDARKGMQRRSKFEKNITAQIEFKERQRQRGSFPCIEMNPDGSCYCERSFASKTRGTTQRARSSSIAGCSPRVASRAIMSGVCMIPREAFQAELKALADKTDANNSLKKKKKKLIKAIHCKLLSQLPPT